MPFFGEIVDALAGKDVSVYIIGGFNALAKLRKLSGATRPQDAEPWTIRGRFGEKVPNNAFHSSDSMESVIREIRIAFSDEDLKRLPEAYVKALEAYKKHSKASPQ
jgi:nucleoside-diphosphate kinase